jgi:hypothetical protein
MEKEENYSKVEFSQSNRWYSFRPKNTSLFDAGYISDHCANNHILYKNKNVLEGIENIRKKDKVYLEGYLVYISGKNPKGTFSWNSSLSRTDRGGGACEVFFVTKIVSDRGIYK